MAVQRSLLLQRPAHCQCSARVADHQWLYGGLRVHELESEFQRTRAKALDQILETLAAPLFGSGYSQAFEGGGSDRRWQRGGVDVVARVLNERFDESLVAGDEPTVGAECLSERANEYRAILRRVPLRIDEAAPGGRGHPCHARRRS